MLLTFSGQSGRKIKSSLGYMREGGSLSPPPSPRARVRAFVRACVRAKLDDLSSIPSLHVLLLLQFVL